MSQREKIASALYDYFNPEDLNPDVDMTDMRHAADAVMAEVSVTSYQRRGLSVGDALVIIGLLAFIVGWVMLWSYGFHENHPKREDIDGWFALIYLIFTFGPPLWASDLIAHIIRKPS